MTTNTTKRKADLKIVILGNASVGKTTLIHRYTDGKFSEVLSTIGASFSLKQWGPYNVAIWDTAGEERFSGLSSFYCRGAKAAILAYDLNSEDSFHSLRARFMPLLQSAEDNCLLVVVGTKLDLLKSDAVRPVPKQDAILLATDINIENNIGTVPYFETSSLTGQNVGRVFEYILNHCLPLDGTPEELNKRKRIKSPSIVDLEDDQRRPAAQEKKGCC